MRDFVEDVLAPVLGVGVLVVLLTVVVLWLGEALVAYQCSTYEHVTGKATQYTGLSCYVQDGGNWYAWSEYKHRLATKGDFSK